MANLPPNDGDRKLQRRTLYLACAALAISVGHVVYAFLRDHVFD
ncbi:MAG: hypothetical protein OSB75_04545 [Dehalococcoidia bacterium]|nr:hypothetical protein [Dehalococcoidia bacterium]